LDFSPYRVGVDEVLELGLGDNGVFEDETVRMAQTARSLVRISKTVGKAGLIGHTFA
jgi:hypothetical protein